jgi:hypothetical protein
LAFLVTGRRIGPAGEGFDDLVGEEKQGTEFGDLFLACRGLADAQGLAAPGGPDDGADLMGLEGGAHAGPGGVEAVVEQGFLDGEEVEGEHAKEDVALDPMLVLVAEHPARSRKPALPQAPDDRRCDDGLGSAGALDQSFPGDLAGFRSIGVNRQWRLIFRREAAARRRASISTTTATGETTMLMTKRKSATVGEILVEEFMQTDGADPGRVGRSDGRSAKARQRAVRQPQERDGGNRTNPRARSATALMRQYAPWGVYTT